MVTKLGGGPLTRPDKESLREAANIVASIFYWDSTVDGSDYWEAVYDKLVEMTKHVCETCGQEVKSA